jgi:hypothetical protein
MVTNVIPERVMTDCGEMNKTRAEDIVTEADHQDASEVILIANIGEAGELHEWSSLSSCWHGRLFSNILHQKDIGIHRPHIVVILQFLLEF